MDAQEFVNELRDADHITRLAWYANENCIGRGDAIILDPYERVAVMVQDCGDPCQTGIKAGMVVKYGSHPEAERRIIGTPAVVNPQ